MQPENVATRGTESDRAAEVLDGIRQRVDPTTFRHWFEGPVELRCVGPDVEIRVGTSFWMSWMQRQFAAVLRDAAQGVIGGTPAVRFTVDPTLSNRGGEATPSPAVTDTSAGIAAEPPSPTPAAAPPSAGGPARPPAEPAADGARAPRRRLANLGTFVVGPSNELAFAASLRFGETGHTVASPLFLHGPVGVGKTHLAEGIRRRLLARGEAPRIVAMTAEGFCNLFGQAIREKSLPAFREKIRSDDLLMLDGVDFFDGKSGFQEELLHTLREFERKKSGLVFTADRHPRLFTKSGGELVSRLLAGTVCRLGAPDFEMRLQIVDRKAESLGKNLTPNIREFVAKRFRNNVRELEGAINVLRNYVELTERPINLTAARRILADLERDCLRVVRVVDVERAVCEFFRVEADDIRSAKRARTVARPRMLAMYLARKHTEAAYSEIGDHFGGRNHSTVISAEKKVKELLAGQAPIAVADRDMSVEEVVELIEARLQAS
ncbi:MAG: DnaA/Hda family protein [Planctomycetota bacterium]